MTEGDTPSPRKRGRGADTAQTKSALLDAAFEALRQDGFANLTARSVADRAHVNQAAIYYHFGGIEPLLLAALERSSQRRLAVYKDAFSEPLTLPQLIDELEIMYEQDRGCGHLRVLAQLVAGSTASPELAAGIRALNEPWIAYIRDQIRRTLETVPLGALVPADDFAEFVFCLVIGMETRDQFDPQPGLSERIFSLAKLAAAMTPTTTKAKPHLDETVDCDLGIHDER